MSADNAGTRHPQRAEIGEDHYAPGRILCRNDPNKGDEPGELAEALASPLTAGQAVEYYEPARYGTLKAWAAQLGMADCEVRIKRCSEQRRRTNC